MSYRITKEYIQYPFAHRHPNHDGKCRWVHGHNWDFTFEFGCDELDKMGFVVDFGKLRWIRDILDEKFNHTLVVEKTDKWLDHYKVLADNDAANIVELDDVSAEGLSKYLHDLINPMVIERFSERVWIHSVSVNEDNKNKAIYFGDK